jgi:hypothetical protein
MGEFSRIRVSCALVGAIMSGLLYGGGAWAAYPASPSDWGFSIAPNVWLSGVSGNIAGPRGNSANFDASIGDVLNHFDGALMLLGEVGHQRGASSSISPMTISAAVPKSSTRFSGGRLRL